MRQAVTSNPDKVGALEKGVVERVLTDFLVVSYPHAARDEQNTFLARIRIHSLV